MKLTIKSAGERGNGLFAARPYERGEIVFNELRNAISGFAYTNHSCEPNCEVQLLLMIANRSIATGEEITIDYRAVQFRVEPMDFDCLCGSPLCRKHIKI